jgi:hypothetical protein
MEALVLELAGASPSTELILELAETTELDVAREIVRPPATIPAGKVSLVFSQLREVRLERELPVDRHTDRIRVQLIDSDAPMDRRFTYLDNDDVNHGDYYYVRVKQQDGTMAWSSPIWVGGEPRR